MSAESKSPFRRAVQDLPPFVAPKTERDLADLAVVRRLNLNESPLGPSPKAIAAMTAMLGRVNRYPDACARDLAAALGARLGIAAARIVFGTGSDELLQLLALVTQEPGTRAIMPTPSFPRYAVATRLVGGTPAQIPLREDGACDVDAMLRDVTANTTLFYLATPNNPTGAMSSADEIARVAAALPPHVLLAVDEAYFEFARAAGGADAIEILAGRTAPWVVLRTFSKAYGLAGLRVGYAIGGDDSVAEMLNRARSVFNLNALAQTAALAALADGAHTAKLIEACRAERERLRAALQGLGLRCLPSVANFLAVELPLPAAEAVPRLARQGILAGAVGAPPFERFLRISVGLADDNDAAVAAIAGLLES